VGNLFAAPLNFLGFGAAITTVFVLNSMRKEFVYSTAPLNFLGFGAAITAVFVPNIGEAKVLEYFDHPEILY